MTHIRVFGCPAQIFIRETARMDKKLSDRSISGTFVGISDKGNGYIFLIRKSNTLVDVDTKDAKFNETFSECRERQEKYPQQTTSRPISMMQLKVTECKTTT